MYLLDHVKPKHHYAHHIPAQIARDALLLDTFVLERKHKPVKQCAQHCKNTRVYERSVISRVIVDQMRKLQKLNVHDGLLGKAKESNLVTGSRCLIALGLRWCGAQCHEGDIVFVSGHPLEVHAGAEADGQVLLLGRFLSLCCQAERR